MNKTEYLIQTAFTPIIERPSEKPHGNGFMVLISIFLLFYVVFILPMKIAWQKLPTLRQYLDNFPECDTGRGVKCCHCGSLSIRNWGHRAANDRLRVHVCNGCGRKLYRSELSKYTTY